MSIVLPLKMYNHLIRFIVIQILLLGIIAGCESFNPDTNIEAAYYPEPVTDTQDKEDYIDEVLKKMYPKIGKYKLKIDKDGYSTKFYMGGNHFTVKFDEGGNWKKSDVVVRYQLTLPPKVKEGIEKLGFDDWYLSDKGLKESADTIIYKMKFAKGEEEWKIWLDRQGNVVKKEKQIKKIKNQSL